MNESNASLYTTTPQSNASSETATLTASSATPEAPKSSTANSSASVEASSASNNASASAEQSHEDYLAGLQDKTLEERTEVNDITSKDRDVIVTEKDGSQVKVQLHAPSYEKAVSINSKRAGFDVDANLSVSTPVRFQKALSEIVGNVTIDGKPSGRFGFKLADSGHADAYRAIIDKAESFLTSIVNAD